MQATATAALLAGPESEVWRSARALAAVEAGSLRIEGNDSGDKGGVFEKSISQMLCYTWLERLVVIRGL